MERGRRRAIMWVYPWDVADEGAAPVVASLAERAGMDGVALAVVYHSGMFLLPHNPRRKLFFPRPGLFFHPDGARFDDLAIRPPVDELAGSGVIEAMRRETAARGMTLHAWVVACHNSGIGFAHPETAARNAFGDRHFPHLCPANPDVRAYLAAVTGQLATMGFDGILLESLEHMGYQHGYHHEVAGLPLTPFASWLLGLCCCPDCHAAAADRGVDAEGVARFARSELEAFFGGDLERGRDGIDWPAIRTLAAGELGAYHDARRETVTSLFAELRATWPAGQGPALELCDFGPLWPLGYDGSATQTGLDLAAIGPYVDAAYPCPYFTDAATIRARVAEYRSRAPETWAVRPIIRAIPPQVLSREALIEQVLACDPAAVDGYGFYNYGFMRLGTLDWIRDGLAAAAEV